MITPCLIMDASLATAKLAIHEGWSSRHHQDSMSMNSGALRCLTRVCKISRNEGVGEAYTAGAADVARA